MLSHEESSTLLDSTMDILEGDISRETPQSGSGVIDQWLDQLRQGENTTDMTNTLERVKTQLRSDQIDAPELADLLTTLATQITDFSALMGPEGDMATRLEGLASALKSLAGQMSNQ